MSGRITAIETAHAQLYNVDVDRKKRIDDAIDYFGGGTSTSPERVSAKILGSPELEGDTKLN